MSKSRDFRSSWIAAIVLGAIAVFAGTPARASLIADGITYTLFESVLSPTEDQFTLDITGINSSTDTEGGRYGVNAIAFNDPQSMDVVSATAPPNFTTLIGGLNSSGCSMTGNFYCFMANTPPSGPTLGANSSLSYTFDVTVNNAGDFAGYNPGFKIEWLGTNTHYDLVSETLTPTVVPLPAGLPLLLGGIVGLGFMRRRKAH
jgi:hypothetical protein